MSAEALLPCPFCGGEAVRKEVNCYLSRGFVVRCIRCHSATCAFYAGFDAVTGEDIPPEEASNKAAKVWNSRRATA